jgi:hypothetical protein
MAARAKECLCGRSLTGIMGSNSTGGNVCLSLVSVVCRQLERGLRRAHHLSWSHTECGGSEHDREASITRRSWPTRGYCAREKIPQFLHDFF